MKDWRDYPGRSQSVDVLQEWAQGLKYFRYLAAQGGHTNDGDKFIAKIAFSSFKELGSALGELSIRLEKVSKEDPWPIHDYPSYQQPGQQTINGVQTFIIVSGNTFDIHISGADGNPYSATELDFINAQKVEMALTPITKNIVMPPIDSHRCVCERYYPELWEKA